MNPEKFDPSDPKYQRVEDLPKKHKTDFSNIPQEEGGGFVDSSAAREFAIAERIAENINKDAGILYKLFNKKLSGIDVLNDAANKVPMTRGYANELVDFLLDEGLYAGHNYDYHNEGKERARRVRDEMSTQLEEHRSKDDLNLYAINEGVHTRANLDYPYRIAGEELHSIIKNTPELMNDKDFAKKVRKALKIVGY